MNDAVTDLNLVEVYQGDLIIHDYDKVSRDQRLMALLRRLLRIFPEI